MREKLPLAELDATSLVECAQLSGLSKSYIYELRAQGLGPRVRKLGKRTIVLREDRLAWLASLAEAGA